MENSHFNPLASDGEDDSCITVQSMVNRNLKNNGMFCPIDFTMTYVKHTEDSDESRDRNTQNMNADFLLSSFECAPYAAPDVLFNVWCAAAAVNQIRYVDTDGYQARAERTHTRGRAHTHSASCWP